MSVAEVIQVSVVVFMSRDVSASPPPWTDDSSNVLIICVNVYCRPFPSCVGFLPPFSHGFHINDSVV